MVTRRGFLKAGGVALFGVGSGLVPAFLSRAIAGASPIIYPFERKKVLVCIFQRGAMDGLMAVTPFEDEYLKSARPGLFMSAVADGNQPPLIDLDGKFGLHPSMKAFEEVFKDKRLAIVHGIGSPNKTRSHFDAQDYMETGTPFSKNTETGWLNRAASLLDHKNSTPFQAVSLTAAMPRSLYGDSPSLAINNLREFAIQAKGNASRVALTARSFEDLYDQTSENLLKDTGKESFEAIKMLQSSLDKNYTPAGSAEYPKSALGNSLKQIAQLIKMNIGLEVAFAESGGWDTHLNQGKQSGVFAKNAADLANSTMAFWKDLDAYQSDVTVMTMTEFGRTVKQNGTGGTDHGRASCNFILGNDVNGGMVHGKVAPLAIDNLEDGRDLAVTTDFRSVFSEVADKHLHIRNNKILFPEWTGKDIGIMKG